MSKSYQDCLKEAIKRGLLVEETESGLSPKKFVMAVDVGCNINQIEGTGRDGREPEYLDDFTEDFYQVCEGRGIETLRVIAFEPLFHQRYKEKYQNEDRVVFCPLALYDEERIVKMKVPGPAHGLASIIDRPVFREIEEEGHTITEYDVQAQSLDIMFYPQGSLIDYLKLDVEGVELKVLQGAQTLLDNGAIRFIQMEIGDAHEEISEFLEQYNFEQVFSNNTEVLFMCNKPALPGYANY